jgi:hypothetical protein
VGARNEPPSAWAFFVCAHDHEFAVAPDSDLGRVKCAICGTAAWEQRGVPPDVPGSVWRVGQALRDEFEAGYLAALAAREEPHFDEVIISREEYEQIRHARGFVGFVAALEKAQAALSLATREDTERPREWLVEASENARNPHVSYWRVLGEPRLGPSERIRVVESGAAVRDPEQEHEG